MFAFWMLRRASETRRGFDSDGALGKRLWMQRRDLFRSVRFFMSIEPINACSLRSPDRKHVKIAWHICQSFRRSCPTEGRRAPGIGFYRHAGPNEPEAGLLFGCCAEPARRAAGLTVTAVMSKILKEMLMVHFRRVPFIDIA